MKSWQTSKTITSVVMCCVLSLYDKRCKNPATSKPPFLFRPFYFVIVVQLISQFMTPWTLDLDPRAEWVWIRRYSIYFLCTTLKDTVEFTRINRHIIHIWSCCCLHINHGWMCMLNIYIYIYTHKNIHIYIYEALWGCLMCMNVCQHGITSYQ